MKIVDKDVQGVLVQRVESDGWFLRLQAPTILEDMVNDPDIEQAYKRNYLWYAMRRSGWEALTDETLDAALESEYIQAVGALQ